MNQNKLEKKRYLVDNLFARMFFIMLIGMLSTMLCNIIDSIVTGQFLGSDAVAAMALVSPVIALISLTASLFTSGTSQLCMRSMGKADIRKVNQVFSTMAVCNVVLCLSLSILLFIFSPAMIGFLSKGANENAVRMAVDYLRGYVFFLPSAGLATLLNGLMVLDNDQKRSVGFAFLMLVLDVVFDLINVLVIHQGMFGMALASTLSCAISLVWLLMHFRKEGHLLHFTPDNLNFGDVKEVLSYGLAGAIPMLMNSIRSYSYNFSLIRAGGTEAVAAFSVANSAFILIIALISTIQSTTGTLSGYAYGEEDINGLERIIKTALSLSYRTYLAFGLLLFVFAYPVSGFFINPQAIELRQTAASFMRFLAAQYALGIASYVLTGSLTGTGHVKLNYIVSILRDGLYPCLSVIALGAVAGLSGIRSGFILAGMLTLATCYLIPFLMNHRRIRGVRDILILPESFYLKPSEYLEASASTVEQVVEMSRAAYDFCIKRGENANTAGMVSLFVEEMGVNAVKYGFESVKYGLIELRLVLKEDKRLIRLKDNGRAFDPVKWLKDNNPEDTTKNLGIRMTIGLAKNVQYIPAMKFNNIMIFL